jgi:hypothetical protein
LGERLLARQGTTRPYGPEAADPVRLVGEVAAVLSIGAGVIHVSAAGDHTNLPVMFAGFLAVATLQVGLGVLLLRGRPSRRLILAALALMLGSIGVWVVSRTAGLPFLEDGHTEPVGFKDGVTVLFEIASVPALLLLLSPDLDRVSLPSPRFRTRTLGAVGAACFALLPPALLLDGGGHHTHEQAVELGIHDEDHGESDELAHGGSESRHSDSVDDHHANGGDGKKNGDDGHGHAKLDKADGGHHSEVELAGSPLGARHQHGGGSAPDDAPNHHGDENDGDGDGEHHRGDRDGDKQHGDGHGGGGHGGGGDGDRPDDDQAVSVTYEPEPRVCVVNVCFP